MQKEDNINYNKLLNRNPIVTDLSNIKDFLLNKKILVTGGCGSIGTEIVIQLCKLGVSCIIIYDNAETPLFYLKEEINKSYPSINVHYIIGDIKDRPRLDEVFRYFLPNIVFHAAAYKHVPMMQNNPIEAIKTNVLGTINISNICTKYNVEKFIMISTDKAVNPTNIMGATKRIAEIYVQSLNGKSNTSFIITRFGNVLGSQGSVIPTFLNQIKNGGPITVTHPDVIRYFMTIPEACQLVLQAGHIGVGGEIFLFKMGDPVKIVDLAKSLIKELSKNTVEIKFIGLRPGEKLYEELLCNDETNIQTNDPNIMILKCGEMDFTTILQKIQNLIKIKENNLNKIILAIKDIIPEFKETHQ